jgi:hypothetical protein
MEKSCNHTAGCELFSQFTMECSLRLWRINYCDSHYERCERYKRLSQGRAVPPDMLPNGKSLRDKDDSC